MQLFNLFFRNRALSTNAAKPRIVFLNSTSVRHTSRKVSFDRPHRFEVSWRFFPLFGHRLKRGLDSRPWTLDSGLRTLDSSFYVLFYIFFIKLEEKKVVKGNGKTYILYLPTEPPYPPYPCHFTHTLYKKDIKSRVQGPESRV